MRHELDTRAFSRYRTMLSLEEVQKLNRELAQRINQEALDDPHSPYAGKWVGIANGQVVVVTDSLEALDYRLREIEPDPQRTFGVDAGRDPNKVEYIWGC
jgi:hypothetical protein